jgi:hypothetical protein
MATSINLDFCQSVSLTRIVYEKWNNLRFEFVNTQGATELILEMKDPSYNSNHQPLSLTWNPPQFECKDEVYLKVMTLPKEAFNQREDNPQVQVLTLDSPFENEVRALMMEDLTNDQICAIIREMIAGRPAELLVGFVGEDVDE